MQHQQQRVGWFKSLEGSDESSPLWSAQRRRWFQQDQCHLEPPEWIRGWCCWEWWNWSQVPCLFQEFPFEEGHHGDMRCHPEREWRGVNPPPSTKTTSSSSVSPEIDGFSHWSITSTMASSDTSPSQPPLRWTNTGRRGQNRIIKLYSTCGSSCNISSLHKGTSGIIHHINAGLAKRSFRLTKPWVETGPAILITRRVWTWRISMYHLRIPQLLREKA